MTSGSIDPKNRIPVLICLGDFASGVTSWAFRLRQVFATNPRFRILLVNCHASRNRIGTFDREVGTLLEMENLLASLGKCIVVPNFVFDVYRVCLRRIAQGQELRCVGFCRADSDREYYNPLAFYEPAISCFAAVSPRCAERLAQRLPERISDISIMPTGVCVPEKLERTYQTSPIRLIYGGRIAQVQKRVLDFVPLVAELLEKEVNFVFDIIGSGKDLPDLQEAMAEIDHGGKVRFLRRLPPDQMPLLWQSHDLFIQVSDFEGTSNSMLESMAQGAIPVLTYTESGVDGIINEGVNGYSVPIGDMKTLATHVARLAASTPEELRRFGEAAWETTKDYSIEAYAKRFSDLLDRTLSAPPPVWPEGRPRKPSFPFFGLHLTDDREEEAQNEQIENPTFEVDEHGNPSCWELNPNTLRVLPIQDDTSETGICLEPETNVRNVSIQQTRTIDSEGHENCVLKASLTAKCSEPGVLGLNIYVPVGGKEKAHSLNHPGDGQWHTLTKRISLPKTSMGSQVRFFVVLRSAATSAAQLRKASLKTISPSGPQNGRYTPPEAIVAPLSASTKRLLILFPSPLRGGAEDYTLTVGKGAIKRGWDVHAGFAFRIGTESLIRDFVESGAQYHPLEIVDVGKSDVRGGFLRRVVRSFRILRKVNPDVVLLELCGMQYGLAPMVGCALAGVPACVVFQLVREDSPLPIGAGWIRSAIRWRHQHYVAVSQCNREILSSRFGMPESVIELIPNGASLERFCTTPEKRLPIRMRIRDELGLPRDCPILITVGRLADQKGHDLLIPIIPHILERHPETRFVWAGEGPLRHRLEGMLKDYGVEEAVSMLGRREDLPDLLAAADLFVHPTRFEGQPFSLVEAIAARLPVVTTRASGIGEVVEHRRHALLCDVEDIRDLRKATLWALDHPEEMRAMAEAALSERLSEFSEDRMLERTLALLESSRK